MRHRTDTNQEPIVSALEQVGCAILKLTQVGSGCPDLLVRTPQYDLVLMEIKTPKGQLSPQQVIFHREWPVYVVRNIDDAIKAINDVTRRGNRRH